MIFITFTVTIYISHLIVIAFLFEMTSFKSSARLELVEFPDENIKSVTSTALASTRKKKTGCTFRNIQIKVNENVLFFLDSPVCTNYIRNEPHVSYYSVGSVYVSSNKSIRKIAKTFFHTFTTNTKLLTFTVRTAIS